MSDTKIDMPKVCQMFDAGWEIRMFKTGNLGSYVVIGSHPNRDVITRLQTQHDDIVDDDGSDEVTTDDFTPEQALTRLAYKVHGEIL
jgi:hypothetical protein